MIIKETDIGGLKRLKAVLEKGGISILPSYTIYGFSASLFDVFANKRIFKLKKRGTKSPFIVIADMDYILELAYNIDKEKLIFLLKNDITVAVRTKIPLPFYAQMDNITAFRAANTKMLRYLSGFFPITSTSINISGKNSINNIKTILQKYRFRVDAVVKGDVKNIASTIVKMEKGRVELIRRGCCLEKIKEIIL